MKVPTSGLRDRLVAPVTAQLRMLDWPGPTVGGDAVKLSMAGRFPTMTVTVAVRDP
jgi:hypothetical protein